MAVVVLCALELKCGGAMTHVMDTIDGVSADRYYYAESSLV